MIEDRPDWVLSRQRAWGVPIAVFADDDGEVLKDEAVNAAHRRRLRGGGRRRLVRRRRQRALPRRPITTEPNGRRSPTFSTSGSIQARPMPSALEERAGPEMAGRSSISKAPTSIAAGSIPRCWKAAARAAARPTTPCSPMASPWPRTAARCRSRSATPSSRRTSSSSPAPISCACGW